MRRIRVVLADDHRLFREGLKRLLDMESDIEVVGEGRDGAEALQIVRETSPDVLLFDVNMPTMNGVELVKELTHSGARNLKFVAITAFDDEDHLAALSSVGVHGYVLKASGLIELLSAIRSVARGEAYVDPHVAGKLLTSFHRRREERDLLLDLTPREVEVLYWLAQGYGNGEIAQRMVLSEKTVKNHISHVLRKLELSDRTQAAVLAWRMGLAQRPIEAVRDLTRRKD